MHYLHCIAIRRVGITSDLATEINRSDLLPLVPKFLADLEAGQQIGLLLLGSQISRRFPSRSRRKPPCQLQVPLLCICVAQTVELRQSRRSDLPFVAPQLGSSQNSDNKAR